MLPFLEELRDAGLLRLATEKAGVDRITAVDLRHPMLSEVDPREYPEVEEDDGGAAVDDVPKWQGQMPKKGSKKVEVKQVKRKQKNVTQVSNLENFGIELDERLKRAIARHFSVAVSYGDGPDATKGKLVFVQVSSMVSCLCKTALCFRDATLRDCPLIKIGHNRILPLLSECWVFACLLLKVMRCSRCSHISSLTMNFA